MSQPPGRLSDKGWVTMGGDSHRRVSEHNEIRTACPRLWSGQGSGRLWVDCGHFFPLSSCSHD